ncbi:MAG: PLP-dependent lyase/thiolase [Patescibacteria group bacterium]
MITPQLKAKKLARALGLKTELFLKREDLHPYGSHKGRSIPLMVDKYRKEGWRNFCISSSGNAALAAIYAIKKLNKKNADDFTLKIFVGEHIDARKLNLIKKTAGKTKTITVTQVQNPKQSSFQLDKKDLAKNLRQSTDDSALTGYEKLAEELGKIKNLYAVFIPTSSGTTAQGLYDGFKKIKISPQIHIVQTAHCHPIVDEVKGTHTPATINTSLASAIVDKIAFRKAEVDKAVNESHGSGWVAGDNDLKTAIKLIKKTENISVSPNSALSVVGLTQALSDNWKFDGPVVCLITGR